MISGHITIQAQERILFGAPAGTSVLAEAERYGARRVFVISTRSLARLENGPLQQVVAALGAKYAGTCVEIGAHSPRADVIAAAAQARAAAADFLVAVGGGSVIDATKAMQLCLWLGLESADEIDPYVGPDARPPVAPPDPIRMIAVPTTLSAAEFTAVAGITNTRTQTKERVSHRLFAPRSVVLDPAATIATPQWLLLSTGIRAVDHAVESYCSARANPITEGFSLQGLRLLSRALPRIKADPGDLEARLEAQFGAWQAVAAVAADTGVGASHGIGYVLGGSYGVPHGHTSCVMLPAVLRWNAAVNGERQRALSAAMGAPQRPAADLIAELIAALELPGSLRAVNISRDSLDEIARRALDYEPVRMNPRRISSPQDVREILELAW